MNVTDVLFHSNLACWRPVEWSVFDNRLSPERNIFAYTAILNHEYIIQSEYIFQIRIGIRVGKIKALKDGAARAIGGDEFWIILER